MPARPRHEPPPQPKIEPHGAPPSIRCRLAQPRILTRDELRTLDRAAVEQMGLPSVLLMENAAIGAADELSEHATPVLVVAGGGNNGGDGLALARQLHIRGIPVGVILVADRDRLSPDAAANLEALRQTEVVIRSQPPVGTNDPAGAVRRVALRGEHGVVVDALFGTGLTRPIEGPIADVIDVINTCRTETAIERVVALDLPSGLDTDTGQPLGATVRADLTVTFAALKAGFFTLEAQPHLGEIVLVSIGVPPELSSRFGAPYAPGSTRHARLDAPSESTAPASTNAPGRDDPTPRGLGLRPR